MDNNFNNQNDNFTYGNQPYDYQPIQEPVIPDPIVMEQPVQGQVASEQSVWNEVPQNNSYQNSTYSNSAYGNASYESNPYQNQSYYNYQQPVQEVNVGGGSKALAIVSLVCGIFSILTMCCGFLGTILSIAAIVTSIVYKSKSVYKKFDGMSLAGLICGIIGFLGGGMFLIFVFMGSLMA